MSADSASTVQIERPSERQIVIRISGQGAEKQIIIASDMPLTVTYIDLELAHAPEKSS